ncbi:MAG: hypothetical protein CMJ76_12770 [Planctomycetaceae bacterium]|nr:hypothetical protein [Planctomycetaceae bacterium]
MSRILRYYFTLFVVISCSQTHAEQPILTIAVVSNPYITTLEPNEIKDERGSVRDFLAKTGPDSFSKAVNLINRLNPDAVVIQGSLTWSGSADDFAAARKYIDQISVPVYTMPGHRDHSDGTLDNYHHVLGQLDADKTLNSVKDVSLVFASDLHGHPDSSTERIRKQLSKVSQAKAVILFADREGELKPSNLKADHQPFFSLVNDFKVALRFDPTRYNYEVQCENTLPVRLVGSLAWSERGSVALVRVYQDRIEVAQVTDPAQPIFSLVVPNPVSRPRLPRIENDAYQCPSYTRDRAAKPDMTFALISDPQFDRKVNRDLLIERANAGIKELNRFAPDVVCVSGDLVNNNLPEEWMLFRQHFDRLKSPLEVVAGNHDVLFNYDFVESLYASASKNAPEYAKLVSIAVKNAGDEGYVGPTALFEKYTGRKPDRIAEYGETAFILISFMTQRADDHQMQFLRDALEKTKNHKHVFVVAHYPSLPDFGYSLQPQLGGDEVLSLLHQYRVTGYLFGHRHYNGIRIHDRTTHVLSDNMQTMHLFHIFQNRITIGRKRIGSPLYERLTIPSTR